MRDRLKSVPHSSSTRLSDTLRERFLHQAEQCEAAGSPLYSEVCRRLAAAPVVAEVAPDDRWDLPLRLLAGLHHIALSDGIDPWSNPGEAVAEHADRLARFVAEQGVQTNEVQRSWMLLPCFLEVAQRAGVDEIDLIELGSSAGLNLVWDRYRYRYAHGEWGQVGATLDLVGEERRPVPAELLRRSLAVGRRTGIDRNPIDVTTDEGARLLQCFVWADQTARLERLEHAIAELRRDPPVLLQGDLVELLPDQLARRRDDVLTLVLETAVLGYLPDARRAEVFAALDEAARQAPLALVRTSQPPDGAHTHYGLWIRLWPGEREAVALGGFHGAWLDWLA